MTTSTGIGVCLEKRPVCSTTADVMGRSASGPRWGRLRRRLRRRQPPVRSGHSGPVSESFFEHLALDAELLPGRDQGAMPMLQNLLLLVELLHFNLEDLLDIFREKGIAEGDQVAALPHAFLDAVAVQASGLEYGGMADPLLVEPLFLRLFEFDGTHAFCRSLPAAHFPDKYRFGKPSREINKVPARVHPHPASHSQNSRRTFASAGGSPQHLCGPIQALLFQQESFQKIVQSQAYPSPQAPIA